MLKQARKLAVCDVLQAKIVREIDLPTADVRIAAGRHKLEQRVPALLQALGASGFAAQALPTAAPGHASLLARERAAAGDEAVFHVAERAHRGEISAA